MTKRLLASYLTLTVFVLLILAIPLGLTFARYERRTLTAEVERDAFVMGSFAEDALEGRTGADLANLVATYQGRTGARAVIVDRQGISVADSDPTTPGERDFSTRPEILQALDGTVASGFRHSETLEMDLLYVAVPVASGGTVHGAVRITYPTVTADGRIARIWLTLGFVALIVLATSTLVGWRFASAVSKPLRSLEGVAGSLARGDLGARATEGGPPEVRALAGTFNDMAARLDELVTAQRAFASDASHQLRTPLTALRLRLETLEESAPVPLAEDAQAAAREAWRLQRIVDGLLALARAEGARPERRVVDVARVLQDRFDTWLPLADERDVRLLVSADPLLRAWEVPGALDQMLDNLLANALDVAPAASRIEITARAAGPGIELHVIDQGPGLNEDERGRAFDRFWRGRSSDKGGSGLGLSIVRMLARASGGDVVLHAGPGGGVDALVTLVAAPAPAAERVEATGGRALIS